MQRTPAELGDVVRQRRLELGLKQRDVIQRANEYAPGSLSEPTLRAIENGRTNAQDRTLAATSRALRWPSDTLVRVRGGAPVPVDSGGDAADVDDAGDEVVVALGRTQRISEDSRGVLLDAYRGAVRRYAELLAGDVDRDQDNLRQSP